MSETLRMTGQQRQVLREGIMSAYPNKDELKILLMEKMDVSLDEIARGGDYSTTLFDLILAFEAYGEIEKFIRVLVQDKPRSPYLQKVIREFRGLGLSQDRLDSLGKKLSYLEREKTTSSDPSQIFSIMARIEELQAEMARIDLQAEINELENKPKAATNSLSTEKKIDRSQLYRILSNLIPSQFNQLAFIINPPMGIVPPYTSSQSDRVFALLTWAESSTGIGLEKIQQALGNILTPTPDEASLRGLSSKFDSRLMEQSQRFLRQAGAEISSEGKWIRVTSISSPRLIAYAPFVVMFGNKFNKQDIDELYDRAKQISTDKNFKIALIFYEEPIDISVKMQMAQVRLENFIIIPISFDAIQSALISPTSAAESSGILTEQARLYLPGADMFNYKNAIGDTLTFYGRSQLLQELQEELIRYQGIGLLGIRKSGKTSILLQLQFSLIAYPVVYIDLQPYGSKNLYGSEIFNKILTRLFYLLRKRDDPSLADFMLDIKTPAKESASKFAESVGFLSAELNRAKFKSPIICLFDELERIFPTDKDSQERIEEFNAFFGTLRQLSQQDRSLAFLIADVHPDFNRTNHWYETNLPTNPVYQFFKEIYVEPFSEEETATMLKELGLLMGVEFVQELLHKINRMSGGHPFVSRQIASVLNKNVDGSSPEGHKRITISLDEPFLDKILTESSDIKSYFKENIWGDMKKRNFNYAMKILSILACNDLVEGVTEDKLTGKLSEHFSEDFSENECDESLSFLRDAGLIAIQSHNYYIKIELMAQWIKRNLTKKEILQWQICSETIN